MRTILLLLTNILLQVVRLVLVTFRKRFIYMQLFNEGVSICIEGSFFILFHHWKEWADVFEPLK